MVKRPICLRISPISESNYARLKQEFHNLQSDFVEYSLNNLTEGEKNQVIFEMQKYIADYNRKNSVETCRQTA